MTDNIHPFPVATPKGTVLRSDVLDRLDADMRDPVYQAALGLRKEIGAYPIDHRNPRLILNEWARQLAALVGDHVIAPVHRYPDHVVRWADQIVDSTDGTIADACERIQTEIDTLDYGDGWPEDRAGYAMKCVCIGLLSPLQNMSGLQTRWPAQASQTVWRFVTGSGNGNATVSFSMRAWQQAVYIRTQAVVDHIWRRYHARNDPPD